MSDAVKAVDVSFSYKEGSEGGCPKAIENVSLRVEAGSYCAILGPNGSGKSTLAKIIDVLEVPDSGVVTVLGVDASVEENFYTIRENCSYVFQNPDNQIVGTIVEEDVAFGPENLGIELPELRKRVDDALKYVGLYELRSRQAASLSGGQKQKLAIAGALAMNPKILILDESTAMLDPQSRDEFLDLVERLNRDRGVTVLTITHDMNEAARCGKIFVMRHGRIVMEGSPEEVFSNPERLSSASLELPADISLIYELSKMSGDRLEPSLLTDAKTRLNTAVSFAGNIKNIPERITLKQSTKGRKLLEVSDLSYSYDDGKSYAIEHIDLEVYEGEILAIVGKSGCGKTTLISHLNGILRPEHGDVRLYKGDGSALTTTDKKNVREIRKSVGLVFQYPEYQLFEETIYKDIAYGIKDLQISDEERDRKIREAAMRAGLEEDVLNQSPFELSGGQKRRAAIAGVLVMEPSVLVLDEPAAGLDPKGRKEMFSLIEELSRKGTTVVLVSHNMDEACRWADRIYCVKDGRGVACKTPADLFENEEAALSLGLKLPKLYEFSSKVKAELGLKYPKMTPQAPGRDAREEAVNIARSIHGC